MTRMSEDYQDYGFMAATYVYNRNQMTVLGNISKRGIVQKSTGTQQTLNF